MNKKTVYNALEEQGEELAAGRWIRIVLLTLILLNVFFVVLQSVESINDRYSQSFYYFELFSVVIFGIEYLVRIWAINAGEKYRGAWGRLRYVFSPLALIDLFSILPFVLSMGFVDLRFLRIARLFRLLRVFKIGRYSNTLRKFSEVAVDTRSEMMLTFLTMLLLLVVGSGAMYFVEHEAQPEVFSSIPAAMWWAVMTMTTVGYGDAYPVTALGKIVASFVSLIGIGMFALPSGILGAAFLRRIRIDQEHGLTCPHCQKKIEKDDLSL
ncbi:ion transporter [Puniceicoccaceae bacterium K14]|nr:ion transporter [Puniceicoccaceae bacterium K14]